MWGNKKVSKLLLTILLFGCVSTPFESKLSKYEIRSGNLNAIPRLDKQGRLFISLNTRYGPTVFILKPKKDSNITTEILESLAYHPFDRAIVLYGIKIKGQVDEYLHGIDYEAFLIAFYDPQFQKYVLVQVDYTKGPVDSLKEVDVKSIMSILMEWVKKLI